MRDLALPLFSSASFCHHFYYSFESPARDRLFLLVRLELLHPLHISALEFVLARHPPFLIQKNQNPFHLKLEL